MNDSLNILMICRELPPVGGGAGAVASELMKQYAARGHRVHYLTMAFGDLPAYEERGERIVIHRLECGRKNQDSSYLLEMLRFVLRSRGYLRGRLQRENFDLVHAHAIIPDGMIGSWFSGTPLFLTAHGSDVPGYNPDRFGLAHHAMTPLWHRTLSQARAVVTPSEHLKGLIIARRPGQQVQVIPNGVHLGLFGEPTGAREDAFLIVSRLVKRKNYHLFLEALARVAETKTVHIVGDGPVRRELEVLAGRLSQHRVVFHGWLVHGSPEWLELYRNCRYFVFPSSSENFPMNLLEAQLARLLVLASPIPANREVLGEHAVFFPELSPQGIVQVLQSLPLADEQGITTRAFERVTSNFSWPAVAARYLDLYAGRA